MLNSTSVAHDDSYVVREHMVRPRYYDPKTGWFLSHDPSGIEASGDYNVDRDAGNNPLNASAPTGVRTFHLGLRRPM